MILKSGADALVNPVNCVGVSGKGLAKKFKTWAPDAVEAYERKAKTLLTTASKMRPGDVWSFMTFAPQERGECAGARLVLFAATKDHWRNPSRIEWVRAALDGIVDNVIGARGINRDWPLSVAVCALGCGNGLLPWVQVRPLIQAAADKMSAVGVDVFVYEPME